VSEASSFAPSRVSLISHNLSRTRFAVNRVANDFFSPIAAVSRRPHVWLRFGKRIAPFCDSFVALREPCKKLIRTLSLRSANLSREPLCNGCEQLSPLRGCLRKNRCEACHQSAVAIGMFKEVASGKRTTFDPIEHKCVHIGTHDLHEV
jgi:hypothetical protein